MNEESLRDELAMERTRLANERTVLAYVRTALALAAAGALLKHYLPDYPSLIGMAWVLFAAGAATLGVGLFRFLRVARRLRGNIR